MTAPAMAYGPVKDIKIVSNPSNPQKVDKTITDKDSIRVFVEGFKNMATDRTPLPEGWQNKLTKEQRYDISYELYGGYEHEYKVIFFWLSENGKNGVIDDISEKGALYGLTPELSEKWKEIMVKP